MGNNKNEGHRRGRFIGLGISLLRGLLLVVLGLSLIFVPDKTYNMLFNAMGMFWLMTGLVLVRRDAHAGGTRLLRAAAICGVVAGLVVLGRQLAGQDPAETWVKSLLGGVILLTGILHAAAQSRFGRQAFGGRPLVNLVLGLAEIALGVLIIVLPTGREQIVFSIAIAWSLLAGGLVLVGSITQWLQERRQQQPDQAAERSGEQT